MMRRAVTLVSVLVAAIAAQVVATMSAGAQQEPRPDASVQVTQTPSESRAHAVPAVAVHPETDRVVAIVEGEAYSNRCTVHISMDAGLSWAATALPQDPAMPNCVYSNFGPIADIAFGPDGTLYVAYSGQNPSTYQSRLFLARSSNLGRNFETTPVPAVGRNLEEGQFGADALPSVAIDPNNPSRVYVGWMSNNGTWNLSEDVLEGRVYFWDIVSRPYVAVSTDGGRSFSEPVDMAGDVEGWMSEPHLAVGDDGALFAFFGENVKAPRDAPDDALAPPAHLYLATSRDVERPFEMKALVTRERREGSDWLSGPEAAVDLDTGDVYVVWDEATDGTPQVVFMRSSDGGRSWSEPVKINDVDPEREWNFSEFFPSISVAPGGRIDVAWYDWRNDPAFDPEEETNRFQDVYYSYSTDRGRTWAPDVKVNDRSIDRSVGIWDANGLRGPIGIASTDDAVYVTWDDSRNGTTETQTQDVYFTRLRFASPDSLFGTSGLAEDSRWLWAALGAALALAAGGLVLLLGTRMTRRRAAPAAEPSPAPKRAP